MTRRATTFGLIGCIALLSALALKPAAAPGQVTVHVYGAPPPSSRAWAAHVIVPQSRVIYIERPAPSPPPPPDAAIQITGVEAGVVILEQVATTTLDVSVRNPGGARVEAELLVPVPDGAVVRSFTFQGSAAEPKAEVLPKEEAKKAYDAIVAKVRDPALLEFAGYNLIRSSVFPVEARGTQKVRLTYEHLLPRDGARVDYLLPRSESLEYTVPWKLSVKIKSKTPIATIYSPTHKIETQKTSENSVVAVKVADEAASTPGPFRLSYLLDKEGVTASLLAYPDPRIGGGYFLLLAGAPSQPAGAAKNGIKREITLVLDRSGSMAGDKIKQVKTAAQQIIAGLEEGETLNIIAYNDAIDLFAKEPVKKSDQSQKAATQYLEGINARGGTNLHDALVEALRPKPAEGFLPLVLFLTDGLPTVGQTSEIAIRNVAAKANPHNRRIFTFGVGLDVNTPLLEKIATETRASPTFVLPQEDVEAKVGQVFKRLAGPVLADAKLEVLDEDGKPAPGRTRDQIPARLPDLFEGDQLVLLGQYVGDKPLHFELTGNYLGKPRQFRFKFALDGATVKNAFVPRLWASRKIAVLVDAIRAMGADTATHAIANPAAVKADPRLKELVDEIVKLSTEFGILTEYTAFLAREGTDLSQRDQILGEATVNFKTRAMATRSGLGAVNQSFNNDAQYRQSQLNYANGYFDANLNRVSITNVQQINDRAFYQRHGRWVDSRLLETEKDVKPTVVHIGSPEFSKLAAKLAEQGRAGTVSLSGDILLQVDDQTYLVRPPADAAAK